MRLLPDIAVRTLLPALNDPDTAVQVNDSVERLLGLLTARADRAERLIGDVGVARVIPSLPRWPALSRHRKGQVIGHPLQHAAAPVQVHHPPRAEARSFVPSDAQLRGFGARAASSVTVSST